MSSGSTSPPAALADVLRQALEAGDVAALERIVGTTHFAVGPAGGHTRFEKPAMLEALMRDLRDSRVQVRQELAGSGSKRYLTTTGWKGEWYRGEVTLLLTRAPKGWQWTAVVLSQPHEAWVDRWRPAKLQQTSQALPFALSAPWPAGQSFKAGGLTQYIVEQAAVVAAGPAGKLILAGLAMGACGFGPRGSYYNQGDTHDEEDAFAIDFTRFERGVPYLNASGGTPLLAAQDGVVSKVRDGNASGDPDAANMVVIDHADPAAPTDTNRFRSVYLHLAGPFQILVSYMMPVVTGQRLGPIDDTGNSTGSHLHFSIHDRTLPHPNSSYGRSVRPTPLSGTRLGDADSGRCVLSDNVERHPGLHFRPSVVNFGSVVPGDSRTMTVTVNNTAGPNVTMSFPASSSSNAIFRWAAVNAVIPNGGETTFQLAFHPTSNAIQRLTLAITSTAPGSPHMLGLLGKGVGGFPTEEEPPLPTALHFSPETMNFGSVNTGSSATRTLTISNMTGRSVFLSYPSSPWGAFEWSAFEGALGHNMEHHLEITFRSSGALVRGSLTVTSNTPSSPVVVVGLMGKGLGGF
jgi:murein DD-endopeptidase MepM/ murein hydrolase activator NlpD